MDGLLGHRTFLLGTFHTGFYQPGPGIFQKGRVWAQGCQWGNSDPRGINNLNAAQMQNPPGRTSPPYTDLLGSSDHTRNRTTLGSRPGSPVLTGHHDEPERSLGDREMEKNSLQDRSGLEDKCSPLLHPWGLAARSLLCSRSQHHRDLMELKALQLHSTYLECRE